MHFLFEICLKYEKESRLTGIYAGYVRVVTTDRSDTVF